MAKFGLRAEDRNGQKFLNYNEVKGIRDYSQKPRVKAVFMIHNEKFQHISSTGFNESFKKAEESHLEALMRFVKGPGDFGSKEQKGNKMKK